MGITEITGFWSIIIAKKIENKSCQSNFDKRLSDFGSFLVI